MLQWLLTRVLRMSEADKNLVTAYDDSSMVSPLTSLVSSRTQSLVPNLPPVSQMESPALLYGICHTKDRVNLPKPKWLRKLV